MHQQITSTSWDRVGALFSFVLAVLSLLWLVSAWRSEAPAKAELTSLSGWMIDSHVGRSEVKISVEPRNSPSSVIKLRVPKFAIDREYRNFGQPWLKDMPVEARFDAKTHMVYDLRIGGQDVTTFAEASSVKGWRNWIAIAFVVQVFLVCAAYVVYSMVGRMSENSPTRQRAD